jgi:hypothetical protein
MLSYTEALVHVNYANSCYKLPQKKALYNGRLTAYNANCFLGSQFVASCRRRLVGLLSETSAQVFFSPHEYTAGEIFL